MEDHISNDLFLGGKLAIQQPKIGYRAGSDAVLLAASVPIRSGESLLDMGCGVGTVMLSVARRVPGISLHGVDSDLEILELARTNLEQNELEGTAHLWDIESSIKAAPAALCEKKFQHVVMNPPYFDRANHTLSKTLKRWMGRHGSATTLPHWINAAASLLQDKGLVTLIYPTTGLPDILQTLQSCGFGGIRLFPLWPHLKTPAKRMIVQAVINSRAPLAFLPGLVLHDADGKPTPENEAITRAGEALNLTLG